MLVALALILAYLIGSIPDGLFWGWIFRRIDVRKLGSGRTGGTNVWRTAGFLPAFVTALTDACKGAAAIWIARELGLGLWLQAVAGTLAVVGHNYSLYLGFKGGAGTMTSIGAAGAAWVTSLPILLVSGTAAGLLIGHASVASILVAILLPIIFAVNGNWAFALGFGLPTMFLTLWALRPNIARLRKQEERFIPIYAKRPPLICLSQHPAAQQKKG